MSRETPYITPGAGIAGLSLLAVSLFAGTTTAAAPDRVAIAPGPREETTMTVANAPRQEDPPARPDLTGLHLSGFGMERDSVSVALEAAAGRLGRAADYEWLYLRSGNAFAPAIATGESCRSWWHVQARAGTGNLPALAASLGLTAEPLVLPTRPAQDDPALAAWFRTAAAAAAAAMDSGAVLLSDGGWDEPGGWNWAGIVTEVGADAAIRGATLSAATGDGKEGVAWRYPATLWAIRPGPPPTLPGEVDRATLRLAVERIRGTGAYAAREDLLFGLPAVDRWIAAMKSDRGFCADCFSRNPVPGVHDAPDNDRRMRAAALVVARNLRGGFSAMPPEARLALDQAANCYQRIAQYLSEPLDTKGFYDSLNSLEAQGLYAQRQLWWVRCELAAAAGRFEEALRTLEGQPGELRFAIDGRTRMLTLEGLASVTNADDPNWFAAGLSFALKQIGVEADYHTLMGDLGTAFIMQASDRSPLNQGALDAGWWPLDPVGPRVFMAFAGRVHGFQAEFASSGSGEVDATAYRERFVARIEAELRARRPCLGFIPCLNVITGLNPETGALLRVCPGTTTMPDSWEADPDARPWELVFLAPRTGPVIPRPEADRQALRHALALMRDEIALPWGYCSGAKAFAIWAAALRDREHLGQHYWHANVVRCLLQSRRAAVVYLDAMAGRWPDRAARDLRVAIGHYQAVIAAGAEADTRETALIRPGEGRETLARLAERIAGLEVQAAAALEQALAEMGYTPDPDPVRLVLAGVPPVSFPGGARSDGAPQMTCFPSCLGAVLRFLQEDFGSVEVDQRPLPPIHPMSPGESSTTLDKSYVLLMGATGAAFRLNWAPDWEPGSDLRWLSDDPWAPFRRGFEAAGRSFELVEKHGMPDDERLFRQRAIASIRQGLPVIARGIIGPPEGCLVSGYDESGAVLTGWSFWQGDAKADPEVGFEPDGSFRKRAWFKDTESLLVLGECSTRPQPREQHRAALGWALQVMRTPVTHKTRANGIAAFDAWAEALRRDGEFDGQDLAGLKRRMVAHLVATDVIAEGRWYAHNYLKTAALDLPEVKDLLRQAAERCRDEHDLVWEMWRVGGSWQQLGDEAALRSFSAAATRRQLADMVLKLRDADREVAAAIEEALGKLVARLDGPPGVLRPDYGKLALAGDHCRQDAFALTMQAAARLFGKEADYDTLHALSTNAFAPDIRPAEPCRCSWAVQGRGRAIDLVAARLGITARKLDLPRVTGAPDCPDDDAGKKQWLRDWCRLPQVPVIREALERGEVVVCELEWDGRDAFWCDWGIILSASGDGDIQGMTVNGRRDNHIVEVRRDGWALSPAATALAPHLADVEMLRRAVRRIRGEGEFAAGRDSAGRDMTWGLPAMDAWIAQMGEVPYSSGGAQPEPDRSRAQAPCTALAVSGGAVVAARYLRGITGDFPVPSRAHLEAAAARYDRIAALLKPALSGQGGESYAQFMGDLAKQRAHIEMALRPARSELLAAAAALEQALLATRVDEPQAGLVPADDTITLNGHPYRLEWVSGARLGELPLSGADAVQPRATDYYPDHADPLHNLHCDVGATGKDEPTGAALQQQGKSWGDHWRDLALATKDRPFALLALSEGKLAGHLRFFSADHSRLRMVPEDQQKAWQQPGTLFITAGCVDQLGAEDRLDAELLRRVIAWARAQGYASVVALGWSNLRTYAIWGESLPADVYAGAGFSVAARLDADAPALADMRAGAHGPAVQQRVEAEIPTSPRPQPESFAVMRLNLKEDVMSPPTVKREGDRVAIAGLEQESWGGKTSRQNSMLACLAIAAQRLGEVISYEEVMSLSAAAFRFQVHKDGMCPSSPHACCGFSCWGLAQQALGITAEHIPTGDKQEANRARARQAVMASIERGIPAFCSSEECSLLVGYDKNGETLLGRWYSSGDPGYAPMKDWPWAVEILRKEAAPDRRQAILRALRSAVDLARTEEIQGGSHYSGFHALRLWVGWLRDQERMARETTDDKRFGTALGSAFIFDCLIDARRAAAIFLRANAQRLGAEAEAPLLRAAQLYDGLQDKVCKARALAPWPWQITPEKPWTPAMMQQQADLVEALIPVEQAAIAEIEQAIMAATIQREGDRVRIDGVPNLRWGSRHECTFVGAMEAALAVTAQPQSYGDIAMDSGLAFRLRWYQGREGQKWCPSTPIGEMGEEWELWASQSGWQIRAVHDGGDKSARIPEIVASIDAGQPVVVYDKGLNMAVLNGYEDHGARLIAHLYGAGADPVEQALTKEELGFLFFYPSGYTKPAPRREALTATLRLIARNWSRAPHDIGKGAYVYGAEGLKAWAGDLGKADSFTEEERRFLFFVSWWTFSNFEDLARFQRPFLEKAAAELGGAAGEHLLKAVAACDLLGPLFGEVFGRKTAFLGPWSGKGFDDWTPAIRQREQEILLAIQTQLGAASVEIEQALGIIDAEGRRQTVAPEAESGFRHDPLPFINQDISVPAALIRTQVFGTPLAGDAAIIAKQVADILAKQRPDGSFGDTASETGRHLDWLAALGLSADRPEFRRGFEAMLRQRDAEAKEGKGNDYGQAGLLLIPINGLQAVCKAGLAEHSRVRPTLEWLAAHPEIWLTRTCPWGATFVLKSLWHARQLPGIEGGITGALAWISAHMNDAGCVEYWDPYAVVGAVGQIELPEARAILVRALPMLLRGQEADGGWGGNAWDLPSVDVVRALRTHGLLDTLRALPPQPSDWRVLRSIPAPPGSLGSMVWLDGRLWVLERDRGELLALLSDDGRVVRRLKVEGVVPVALGRWAGGLALTQDQPKRVLKVNPDSAAIEAEIPLAFAARPQCATMVGGQLWISDGWVLPGWVLDPAHPDRVPTNSPGADFDPAFRLEHRVAGTLPLAMAATDDGLWSTDHFSRCLLRSGPGGRLLEWGEMPFGGTNGIAWDGQNLWAIDHAQGRICLIERSESGKALLAR